MTTTATAETRAAPRQAPRYIYVTRPRCPTCGSVRLRAEHSTRRSSGVTVRHSRCQVCGQRVYIVVQ
jgi:ribosomal protein S27AE